MTEQDFRNLTNDTVLTARLRSGVRSRQSDVTFIRHSPAKQFCLCRTIDGQVKSFWPEQLEKKDHD